jgi:hypothetical protein
MNIGITTSHTYATLHSKSLLFRVLAQIIIAKRGRRDHSRQLDMNVVLTLGNAQLGRNFGTQQPSHLEPHHRGHDGRAITGKSHCTR